jgi:hypothetical protein
MPSRSETSSKTTRRSAREWQRLDQHAVDDAEQRRVDADAKRQAEDDDGGRTDREQGVEPQDECRGMSLGAQIRCGARGTGANSRN